MHCSLSTGKRKLSRDPQRYHMTIPAVKQIGNVVFSEAHSQSKQNQSSLTQDEDISNETNENGNTACQKRRDAAKAVLRGKFIATSTYMKKNTACGIGCSSRVLFYCSIVDLQHCANL